VDKKLTMNLKKLALSGVIFGSFSLAQAGALEELVKALQQNGYITEEQAERILKAAKEEKKTSEDKEVKKIVKALKGLKIGGVAFLHYDYQASSTDRSSDDKNQFKVDRAYFEVRKYFDKDDYFRITTDVHQDSSGDYKVRLKYAYLNWKLNDYLQTEVGLAHRAAIDWLEHHIWLHRYMDKTFIEDKKGAHLINSADVGIALKGKVQNLGYMFGIYNGEGYHAAENDHHFGKSIEGRINYEVVKGFTIGLHSAYVDNDNYWSNSTTPQVDRLIVQPFMVYKNAYFLVGAQYIYNKDNDYYVNATTNEDFNNYGWAINGDLYLKQLVNIPATLFGRVGVWNYDDDWTKLKNYSTDSADRVQYLIGAEYTFNKHVKLGVAWKHVDYQDEVKTKGNAKRDYEDLLRAAMQVKW